MTRLAGSDANFRASRFVRWAKPLNVETTAIAGAAETIRACSPAVRATVDASTATTTIDWASSPSEGKSMKREIWEELVDRAVDGECLPEEKRALDEAAARNPEIRDAIDSALRIRDLMRSSAGASVPPEFSERLRLAIERSDFWVEREVAQEAASASTRPIASASRRERFGGRRFVAWAATGAAVSFAAVALFASNLIGGSSGKVEVALNEGKTGIEKIDETGKAENFVAIPTNGAALKKDEVGDSRPDALITPRPVVNAPSEPVVATPSDFYTRRVLDSGNARRLLTSFILACNRIGLKIEKIDGDFELLLPQTTPEQRRVVSEWLEANAPDVGERGSTAFAERWNVEDKDARNVRVSFSVVETAGRSEIE